MQTPETASPTENGKAAQKDKDGFAIPSLPVSSVETPQKKPKNNSMSLESDKNNQLLCINFKFYLRRGNIDFCRSEATTASGRYVRKEIRLDEERSNRVYIEFEL